ncbi:MAG TPA: holo-ACP synthase [Phycisphaerales bacterium]|nr:holo-ACP synthase [Phycisphaerales bacterium]
MRLVGHGVDLVEVSRIEAMLAEHGGRMTERVFTAGERAECESDVRRVTRYAARFAAKEAALKALGTGLADGITWQDVSIENDPHGAPRLLIAGRALEVARERGVIGSLVSLSHTRSHAIASVILYGEP